MSGQGTPFRSNCLVNCLVMTVAGLAVLLSMAGALGYVVSRVVA